MHHKYILGLSRRPGDRRGAKRTGGSKGREGHVKYYTPEDEAKYGVLAIELEKI